MANLVWCTRVEKKQDGTGDYIENEPIVIDTTSFYKFERYYTSGGVEYSLLHSEGDDYYFKEPLSHFTEGAKPLPA